MKIKLAIFILAILSVSTVSVIAQASELSEEADRRVNVAVGYSYQRKSADKTFSRRVFETGESNRDLNGINVEGTYYFQPQLGITGNFSAHTDKDDVTVPVGMVGSTVNQNVRFKEQAYNFMIGPQMRFLNDSPITPFARVLFGAQTTRTKLEGLTGTTGNARTFIRTNFAMAIGGGLDVRVNKNFAVRAIQIDYLPSFERRDRANVFGTGRRFDAERVDQLRIGFGVVFK